MREVSTPRDLVGELNKLSKRRWSRPPGFQDWVMVTEPIDIAVSKNSFKTALEFIEKITTEMPSAGISF
jgi:hypothetical protein